VSKEQLLNQVETTRRRFLKRVVGGGGLCAFGGMLIAGLALLAARRPSEGRSRGD
jgi:hypothetical protein